MRKRMASVTLDKAILHLTGEHQNHVLGLAGAAYAMKPQGVPHMLTHVIDSKGFVPKKGLEPRGLSNPLNQNHLDA